MLLITIISIIIYVVAILITSTNIYGLEKQKKMNLIISGIVVIFIATYVITIISSMGIKVENNEYLRITKLTSVLIFAPINTILALPYFGNLINRYKQKKLTETQFKNRLLVFVIILIIIAIIEISNINSFELGLLSKAEGL